MRLVTSAVHGCRTCGAAAMMVLAAGVFLGARHSDPDWSPYEY